MPKEHLDQLAAEREMVNDLLNKTRDEAERFPSGSPEREAAYKKGLDDIIRAMVEAESKMTVWDFSSEKAQPVFANDQDIVIRPISAEDVDFYVDIRMQYSMMYRVMVSTESHSKESLFLLDLCKPECFYCIIETADRVPIGYLGIKDTRAEVWELAIELDKQYTQRGLGPRSIVLFLNEVSRITGKTQFSAKVEADNIPSQKCFEGIGAVLTGLCDGPLLKTPDEKKRFEDNNLNLIDDNIRAIANRLGVEPQKLLSHVLEYRMECPL